MITTIGPKNGSSSKEMDTYAFCPRVNTSGRHGAFLSAVGDHGIIVITILVIIAVVVALPSFTPASPPLLVSWGPGDHRAQLVLRVGSLRRGLYA